MRTGHDFGGARGKDSLRTIGHQPLRVAAGPMNRRMANRDGTPETANMMPIAHLLCGLAAAVIVPWLAALIATNCHGAQQSTAVGALGSAHARAWRLPDRRLSGQLDTLAAFARTADPKLPAGESPADQPV
jgi:hypothetical protein